MVAGKLSTMQHSGGVSSLSLESSTEKCMELVQQAMRLQVQFESLSAKNKSFIEVTSVHTLTDCVQLSMS